MAAKRFKLTQEMIDSMWTQNNSFSFKVGFEKDGVIRSARSCAQITIADTDVVQTTNPYAQKYLTNFIISRGIRINGVLPPEGMAFVDVTGSIPVANVDLDPFFS